MANVQPVSALWNMIETPIMGNGDRIRCKVKRVRKGNVATYGDISQEIYGHRRNGRPVASAIKGGTKRDPEHFPWWRVVHDNGGMGRVREENQREQARRLKEEGVEVNDALMVVDMDRYRLRKLN